MSCVPRKHREEVVCRVCAAIAVLALTNTLKFVTSAPDVEGLRAEVEAAARDLGRDAESAQRVAASVDLEGLRDLRLDVKGRLAGGRVRRKGVPRPPTGSLCRVASDGKHPHDGHLMFVEGEGGGPDEAQEEPDDNGFHEAMSVGLIGREPHHLPARWIVDCTQPLQPSRHLGRLLDAGNAGGASPQELADADDAEALIAELTTRTKSFGPVLRSEDDVYNTEL